MKMSPKDGGGIDPPKHTNKYTISHPAMTAVTQLGQEKTADGKTETPKAERTWREKLRLVANNITVEPILAAYIMPSVLSNLATQNLNLEKACRVNMAYGDEICDALTRRQTANYTL